MPLGFHPRDETVLGKFREFPPRSMPLLGFFQKPLSKGVGHKQQSVTCLPHTGGHTSPDFKEAGDGYKVCVEHETACRPG